ncbi:uncharacterized protein LOC117105701 isoform X2 [Anneissia japonica]|nr:uncharacterized protein LOC117105701 isoform X2 [Anneissia japonica]
MQQCTDDTLFRLYCKVVYALVTHVHELCKCKQCLVQLTSVIDQLCSSCARYIISDDLSYVPEAFRLNLSDALQAAQEKLGDWAGDRFFRLAGLCVAPWSHPFLIDIMEGSSEPQGLERTQNYISYEGFDLLSARVQILLKKDPEKALKLCQACAQHKEIGKDTVFLETTIVILYNQGMPPDFSMQVWTQDSTKVLRALQNMLTYFPPPVVKLVDTLLLKEWNMEYASLDKQQFRDLLKLWVRAHHEHGSLDDVYRAAVDLAMYNDNTHSVILFADSILKLVGPKALPLFVNLLVDNIQVPFHRLDENECDMANQNNTLISERLADELWANSQLHCLCRMAHFVSSPSKPNFLKLEKAYEASNEECRYPEVPLLSSRLDLILTKVILGLLPKAFNPWKSWDNLKQLCQKLQKTTKQFEIIKEDGTEKAYKKPSWFLMMLEEDWSCYAKGSRDQDGEVVCDSQDEAGDAVQLLTDILDDKPASIVDLDSKTNSAQPVAHKNEDWIKKTKNDENQDKCRNSEKKSEDQRGRKSRKGAIEDKNKVKKRKKRKNIDEKELNTDQKCVDAKDVEDKGAGTNAALPLLKCTSKKQSDNLPSGNMKNRNGLNKKFGIKQRNGIKSSSESTEGKLVTIESGKFTGDDSLDSLEKFDGIENDSMKKNLKGGKKRRRQRDDFGIGRKKKKPQKKVQTSEEMSNNSGLKSQEADDELEDSDTDGEIMSDIVSPRDCTTSDMFSSKSNEKSINRCCLTQLETPPPDSNSYIQLPGKTDAYGNTQLPALTPGSNFSKNMFTNGDCVKDQVCLIEFNSSPKENSKSGYVPSSESVPVKNNRANKESKRGRKRKCVVEFVPQVKKANDASLVDTHNLSPNKKTVVESANKPLLANETNSLSPSKGANNTSPARKTKTFSPTTHSPLKLLKNSSPLKETKDASPFKKNFSPVKDKPSPKKVAKNVSPAKKTKTFGPAKDAYDPSFIEDLNDASPVKERNHFSPVKKAKAVSPVKEQTISSLKKELKKNCTLELNVNNLNLPGNDMEVNSKTTPTSSDICNNVKSIVNPEEKIANNTEVNSLTGIKLIGMSTTNSSGILRPVNHHVQKIVNDSKTLLNKLDHTSSYSDSLSVRETEPNQLSGSLQTNIHALQSSMQSTYELGGAQNSNMKLTNTITSGSGSTKVDSKHNRPIQTFPVMWKASPGMRLTHSRVLELSKKSSQRKRLSEQTNKLDEIMPVDVAANKEQDSVQEPKLTAKNGTGFINDVEPDKDHGLSPTSHDSATVDHNLSMCNEILNGSENKLHVDKQTAELNGLKKKIRKSQRKAKRVVLRDELGKALQEKERSKNNLGAECSEEIEHGLSENSRLTNETRLTERHSDEIQGDCCENSQPEKRTDNFSGMNEISQIIHDRVNDKMENLESNVANSKTCSIRKQTKQHQVNIDVGKMMECEMQANNESDSKKKRTTSGLSKIRNVYGTRSSNLKLNSTELSEEKDKNLATVVNKRIGRSPSKRIISSGGLDNENKSVVEMHNTRFRQKKCTEIQAMEKISIGQATYVGKTSEPIEKHISSVTLTNQCTSFERENIAQPLNQVEEIAQTSNRGTGKIERVRRSSGRHVSEKGNSRTTKNQSRCLNRNNTVSESVEEHNMPSRTDLLAKGAEEDAALNRKPQTRRICTRRQSSFESKLLSNCAKVNPSLNLVNEDSTESTLEEVTFQETKRVDEIDNDKPLFKEIKRYTRERKSL